MEDSQIIELFFVRSEQAIVVLSDKYGSLCKQLAYRITGSERDAEECVNDAFLGVWNAIPPERPASLVAFVCGITRNLALKRYRDNTAAKRNSLYDLSLDELAAYLPTASTVEQEYDEKELAAELDRFLCGCKREDRIIFVRRYYFSDSIAEIAALLDVKEHAVSVRLHRTKLKLKKHLQKKGMYL